MNNHLHIPRTAALLASAVLAAQQSPAPSTPAQEPAADATTIVVPGVRKLVLSGQYRLRYESQIEFDFDKTRSPGTRDFFTQRARLGLDFDFNDELGAFLQLQDARDWGEEVSTTDDAADGLDLHQAYVDAKHTPGIGGSTRIGRQQLSLGDQRLIGALDWRTQARSFDGVLQSWRPDDGATMRAFAYALREPNVTGSQGTLTPENDDQWLLGSYNTWQPGGDWTIDGYLLFLNDDGAAGSVTEHRGTLGGRLVWREAQWEVGSEVATQFGERGGSDIPILETYALHAHATHWFDAACKPWLRLECNAASGDDPATADIERFNNLFPTAHMHWGMMDLALWENLFNPMAQVGARIGEKSDMSLSWNLFRSMEATDRFGGPNGTLTAAGAGTSRSMGTELDLVFTHPLAFGAGLQSSLQLGYGIFLPGAGVNGLAAEDTAHFVYVQFDLRF